MCSQIETTHEPMRTVMLVTPKTTQGGEYQIDGWRKDNTGNGFALVRGVGWCLYLVRNAAILIPRVGWVAY